MSNIQGSNTNPHASAKSLALSGQITAQLTVSNLEAAAQFYETVFGMAPIVNANCSTGVSVLSNCASYLTLVQEMHTKAHFGVHVRSPKTLNEAPSNVFTFYSDDIVATYQKALQCGAKSIAPPTATANPSETTAMFQGIEGYVWRLIPTAQVNTSPEMALGFKNL